MDEAKILQLAESCKCVVRKFPYFIRQGCLEEIPSIVYLACLDAEKKGLEVTESNIRYYVTLKLRDYARNLHGLASVRTQRRQNMLFNRVGLLDKRKEAPDTTYDLKELMEKCISCDGEKAIVELYLEGYTLREIANMIDTSVSRVHRAITTFRHNFTRMYHESIL